MVWVNTIEKEGLMMPIVCLSIENYNLKFQKNADFYANEFLLIEKSKNS